jgi:hypothetical protein
MSEQNERGPEIFVPTRGYRLFADVCDACRRFRSIGLGYGPPGTGKTKAAGYYTQWDHVEEFFPESLTTFTGQSAVDSFYPYKPFTFSSAPSETSIQECRTVFLYPSDHCFSQSHRKSGASLVRSVFVSGGGR